MKFDKLVRDKIPAQIRAQGREPMTHVADDAEYLARLKAKLAEEVAEFDKDENMEELADVLEVVDALIAVKGFDRGELQRVKEEKKDKKGGFADRIVLDEA